MPVIIYRTYDIGGGGGCRIDYGFVAPTGVLNWHSPPYTEYTYADADNVWTGYWAYGYSTTTACPIDPSAVITSPIVAYNIVGGTISVVWHLVPWGEALPSSGGNYVEYSPLYDTPAPGGDPIEYNPTPTTDIDSPSIAIDSTGHTLCGYVSTTNVYAKTKTRDDGSYVAVANRAGKQPAAYWWYGQEHVVYVNGTDSIRDWDCRTGEEENLVTGTHPCVAINPGGSIKAVAYLVGTAYKCTIYGGAGNVIGSEHTILASGAPDAAGSLAWTLDGHLTFTYAAGTTTTTLTASADFDTWT
jgi:hypothetical protein